MDIKLKMKIGSVEVDYEGEAEFFKNEFPSLIEMLSRGYNQASSLINAVEQEETFDPVSDKAKMAKTSYSVSTIAGKLNASTGPELLLAAASCLTFTDGREAFSRQELLKKMQDAKSYYKKSYGSNLSKMLSTFVKSGALLEGTSNAYSLSAEKGREIRGRLGI